jgi:hypothetical protein
MLTLTAKEVYRLAASGVSVAQIREIEVRRTDRLLLTTADARFLARCGVRVDAQDRLSRKSRTQRKS